MSGVLVVDPRVPISKDWTLAERARVALAMLELIQQDIYANRYSVVGRPNVTSIQHVFAESADTLEAHRVLRRGDARRGREAPARVRGADGEADVSFFCKACGRQRAGSPAEGEEVCDECRPTQAGRAFLLLASFEGCQVEVDDLSELEHILGEAQNNPPAGASDGSLTERRWYALRDLVAAATKFNEAIDDVQLATSEVRP